MDLAGLNESALDAFGEAVTITVEGRVRELLGIYEPGYASDAVGAGIPQRSDPFFMFALSHYQQAGGQRGALVRYQSIDFTVISDPEIDAADWCRVRVRAYG